MKYIISLGIVIFFVFFLAHDYLEVLQLKKTISHLKQIQQQKEVQLQQKLTNSQKALPQKNLLDHSTLLLTLARLCESAEIKPLKIQIKKIKPQIENHFEGLLQLQGDYLKFIHLMNAVYQSDYSIDCKTLMMSQQTNHPLTIKLKLHIASNDASSQKKLDYFQTTAPRDEISPFLIRRYSGKITIFNRDEANKKKIDPINIPLVVSEDNNVGTCILSQKLEYSPSIE